MAKHESSVPDALDACGIGADLQERLSLQLAEIDRFCGALRRIALLQALHNLFRNVPEGILSRREASAEHAIVAGIAGAVTEYYHAGVRPALLVAAEIAEDVNAHSEAEKIRRMADANA